MDNSDSIAQKFNDAADASGSRFTDLSMEKVPDTLGLQFSDYHLKFADFEEAYLSRYIQLADVKSGATFAIVSGLLVFLVDKRQLLQLVAHPQLSWTWFLAFLSGLLLLLSSIFSFAVVFPRLRSGAQGIVFWKNVTARASGEEYARNILVMNSSEITLERLQHCFALAKVCGSKYWMLRIAMLFGSVGVILSCYLLAFN